MHLSIRGRRQKEIRDRWWITGIKDIRPRIHTISLVGATTTNRMMPGRRSYGKVAIATVPPLRNGAGASWNNVIERPSSPITGQIRDPVAA